MTNVHQHLVPRALQVYFLVAGRVCCWLFRRGLSRQIVSRSSCSLSVQAFLLSALCSFLIATGLCVKAAVFDFAVTMDLSDPSVYFPHPELNQAYLTMPLAKPAGSSFGSGDTLDVTLDFSGDQRLLLTANPTGEAYPIGHSFRIGVGESESSAGLMHNRQANFEFSRAY
jgi:hypothetical protein